MTRAFPFTIAALVLAASPALAQSESALKQALEGQTMVLRIGMPATQLGVDVYPTRPQPVDFGGLARRVKEYGTAIHQGESQTITTIKVKRDHIEVHLGGGGFGTFTDLLSAPQREYAPSPYVKTSRERDLENRIKNTSDAGERRRLQRELDTLRADKRAASADAAMVNRMADQEERDRRLQSGSRFNVRFDGGSVPPEYLTPDGLASALARFGQVEGVDGPMAPAPRAVTPAASTPLGGIASLKKGLTLEQVEKALGPADEVTHHDAGGIEVIERTYVVGERQVVARFVSGVLIEYLIQSK